MAYVLWQKFSEKKGNNLAIFYAALFMACCPFFYIISKSMFQVAAFTVVTGSATAGTLLLLSNNLYETAPDENRTIYIAAYTVLTNITLIFAPIIGMKIKNITNIYIALLIVGILRILSSFTFYFRYKYLKNKELV
nr:MFS transporter [Clostridium sp. JN-9]